MSDTKLSMAIDMMIKTDRMHKALIDSRAKETGIHRTQLRILMRLERCGQLPSQKELAEHLEVSAAAITGALKKIERDGYVVRTLGHDNRYNEIKITERGRALVELTRERFVQADASMFDGFSGEELDTYIACMQKFQANIKKQQGKEDDQ